MRFYLRFRGKLNTEIAKFINTFSAKMFEKIQNNLKKSKLFAKIQNNLQKKKLRFLKTNGFGIFDAFKFFPAAIIDVTTE